MDVFHLAPTPSNLPEYIERVNAKRAAVGAIMPTDKDMDLFQRADKAMARRDLATPAPWISFPKPKYKEWHVSVPLAGSTMTRGLFDDGIPTDRPEADANFIGDGHANVDLIRDFCERLREIKREAESVEDAAAWMNPENPRDPVGAEKLRDLQTINGAPGKALAARYTVPLFRRRPDDAARIAELERLLAQTRDERDAALKQVRK